MESENSQACTGGQKRYPAPILLCLLLPPTPLAFVFTKIILFSRLFKVNYKKNLGFLGVNKFNYYTFLYKNLIPLGGINYESLNKIKSINSEYFAILSEVKKKPAKIFSRLF